MGAPIPLQGNTNPWTAAYQTRQFKVTSMSYPGSNAVHGSLTGAQNVFDALNAPPSAATNAVIASDPLEEQADFWLLTPQVLTVMGAPSAGTFQVAWPGSAPTGNIAFDAAAATVQTAIRLIAALNAVTVAGSAGGPWTVSGAQLSGQLLVMTTNALTGGTKPFIQITSPAAQAGIVPF